jgi:LmbE family N-acetylglucosaminyl deacetylase
MMITLNIQTGKRGGGRIAPMHWVFLSPHFDDVALSCGGLVWEQVQAGEQVIIWTVCAGIPDPMRHTFSPFAQELHARWGAGPEAVTTRQAEDIAACRVMGAAYRHLPVFDCIYRLDARGQPSYASEQALSGPLHPDEAVFASQLSQLWQPDLPLDAMLVCPLALGNHVDHQLTRLAAEQLGRPLWYYADYPYVRRIPHQLSALTQVGWRQRSFELSEAGLVAWQNAVAAHASQISTFWADEPAMRADLANYAVQEWGVCLWQLA